MPGKRFDLNTEEFAVTYTAAQYTVQVMATPGGLDYLNKVFRSRTEEWKKEMVEYFRDTCMYVTIR